MALPSSGNITLSAIQTETSTGSLNAAGGVAGFTGGGTAMTEFYGWSPEISLFTPNTGWADVAYPSNVTSTYLQLSVLYSSYFDNWYHGSVEYSGGEVGNFGPGGFTVELVLNRINTTSGTGIYLSVQKGGASPSIYIPHITSNQTYTIDVPDGTTAANFTITAGNSVYNTGVRIYSVSII